MYEQPNGLDNRVGQLDESVERLTSEVASLKLELATLVSALREIQQQSPAPQRAARSSRVRVEPPSRPSPAPAATVVLIAVGFLSWQLITGPRRDRVPVSEPSRAAATERAARDAPPAAPIESPATEPPLTPLVAPTIYKGTLSVNAAQPGARVFVNRREVGTVPVRLRNLRAGAHLVWIESDGYRRWTRVVTVPAERVTRVSATLEPLDPPAEH